MTFFHMVLVGVGGFFGSIARFSLSELFKRQFTVKLPVATLGVNVIGSFLLGLFIGVQLDELWLALLGTGFLGAFTTFSTFTLENIQLLLQRERIIALTYIIFSLSGAILFAYIGYSIAHLI